MFNKFQDKIKNLMEDNSVGGGALGPNATENTFENTPIKTDMAIAGGVNPKKKKKPHFPVQKRPLNKIKKEL
jgi:hypothetical protein